MDNRTDKVIYPLVDTQHGFESLQITDIGGTHAALFVLYALNGVFDRLFFASFSKINLNVSEYFSVITFDVSTDKTDYEVFLFLRQAIKRMFSNIDVTLT